jgi:predicted transcriptional regulator
MRDTQAAAYHKAMQTAPNVRQKIMLTLGHHGPAASFELEVALNKPHQTISDRLSELAKAGRIIDSGKRKQTPYGLNAIVWKVA